MTGTTPASVTIDVYTSNRKMFVIVDDGQAQYFLDLQDIFPTFKLVSDFTTRRFTKQQRLERTDRDELMISLANGTVETINRIASHWQHKFDFFAIIGVSSLILAGRRVLKFYGTTDGQPWMVNGPYGDKRSVLKFCEVTNGSVSYYDDAADPQTDQFTYVIDCLQRTVNKVAPAESSSLRVRRGK